jgi:hypothetical protein
VGAMKVYELFQCIFWAVGGVLPPALFFLAGDAASTDRESGAGLLLTLFGAVLQVAVIACAYKAGGK